METERPRGAEFPKRDGGRVSPARAGVSDSPFGKSPTARAGESSRPGTDHGDAKKNADTKMRGAFGGGAEESSA